MTKNKASFFLVHPLGVLKPSNSSDESCTYSKLILWFVTWFSVYFFLQNHSVCFETFFNQKKSVKFGQVNSNINSFILIVKNGCDNIWLQSIFLSFYYSFLENSFRNFKLRHIVAHILAPYRFLGNQKAYLVSILRQKRERERGKLMIF